MSLWNKVKGALGGKNDSYDDEFLDDDFDIMDDDDDEFFADDEEKKPNKFFEKFSKKPVEDDDFDSLDDEPIKSFGSTKSTTSSYSYKANEKAASTARTSAPKQEKASSKIMPMRGRRSTSEANLSVCVIKPQSMEDAKDIAETLVKNCTVILNLEGIDVELAQRIVDFTAGACYSLGGNLMKISSYIFVLGPYNVDVSGDLQNILGSSAESMSSAY